MIFFPNRDVTESDLVAAGVDKTIAHRIYTEMAHLGNMTGKLVVEQQGERLAFTSAWHRFADPPESLVVSQRKTSTAAIELKRENGIVRVVGVR